MASPIAIKIWTSFLLAICCFSGAHAVRVTLTNNCAFPVSPVAEPQVDAGGQLQQGGSRDLDISSPWSGRIYPRFDGDGGYPPATLAEFTLGGGAGNDYYDVSLVDGFNLPLNIVPSGGCRTVSCPVDINSNGCPSDLAITGGDGRVVGCKSACLHFGTPEYCCTGEFMGSACMPSSYSQTFKNLCPDAYTYASDDSANVGCPIGNSYTVTFCP